MMQIFSDETRRNPYPPYDQLRTNSPVLHVPPPFNGWMVFDYDGVKRALTDSESFSSGVPAPKNWFTFFDPPRHTKLRGMISRAFIPKVVTNLEPQIRQISRALLDEKIDRGQMDLATEYSVPLPMKVIARMIGIPDGDWARFRRWSDTILRLSYTRQGDAEAARVEARIALTDLLSRMSGIELIGDGRWEPRKALHVHGPAKLPIRFTRPAPGPAR